MSAKKRSIYLVNSRFQLKWALIVCFFVLISSLVYHWTIYNLIENLSQTFSNTENIQILKDQRWQLLMWLGLYQIALTLLIFILCIFQSHKVAGPLFKLKNFLRNVADGNPPTKLSFRNGDYFEDIADTYNEMISSIQNTQNKDFAYLSEVNSYIETLLPEVRDEKKAILIEIIERLEEIQNRFRQRR